VRYRSLQQLCKWLTEEGEVARRPMMVRVRPRAVREVPVPVGSDDERRELIEGVRGVLVEDRRDVAIWRTFVESGCGLDEVTGLKMEDVDLDEDVV
jgi:site-specific recombinase XerC